MQRQQTRFDRNRIYDLQHPHPLTWEECACITNLVLTRVYYNYPRTKRFLWVLSKFSILVLRRPRNQASSNLTGLYHSYWPSRRSRHGTGSSLQIQRSRDPVLHLTKRDNVDHLINLACHRMHISHNISTVTACLYQPRLQRLRSQVLGELTAWPRSPRLSICEPGQLSLLVTVHSSFPKS